MKLQYHGMSPVDIAGHENVQPGDVVDVDKDLAASLLLAGCSIDDDGNVTPADPPLWAAVKKSTTTDPADAGKES